MFALLRQAKNEGILRQSALDPFTLVVNWLQLFLPVQIELSHLPCALKDALAQVPCAGNINLFNCTSYIKDILLRYTEI